MGGIERLALSFGLSIAIVPLMGIILNFTPWGILFYPILISITLFIMVTSAIGWYRQQILPASDRFSVTFKAGVPKWVSMTRLDKALSISLVIVIVAVLGCLSYLIAVPKQGEKFTEFYILNIEGKAVDYPKQVKSGEPVEVIIGIVNHDYQPASYRVGITIDDVKSSQAAIGMLAHEEKWEEKVSFTPKVAGEKQKVEFYLYKDVEIEPYYKEPLRLYIDVTLP